MNVILNQLVLTFSIPLEVELETKEQQEAKRKIFDTEQRC